eukprot:scaffold1803_cov320-Prasinococcus_capsulatus_cf.AAC.5
MSSCCVSCVLARYWSFSAVMALQPHKRRCQRPHIAKRLRRPHRRHSDFVFDFVAHVSHDPHGTCVRAGVVAHLPSRSAGVSVALAPVAAGCWLRCASNSAAQEEQARPDEHEGEARRAGRGSAGRTLLLLELREACAHLGELPLRELHPAPAPAQG